MPLCVVAPPSPLVNSLSFLLFDAVIIIYFPFWSVAVSLSLKDMQADPLKETIDTVMQDDIGGLESGASGFITADGVIEGFGDFCELLSQQSESIFDITPTKVRSERHVVSQQMEVYLTTETIDDGFNVVIRDGGTVQEAHVSTSLSREEMKAALMDAASRLAVMRADKGGPE